MAKGRKDYVITGPGWHPALAALVLATRFPHYDITIACEAVGVDHELETFVFDDLSDDLAQVIADAVVRQWDDFIIAGRGQIKSVRKAAGVFDPGQLMVDAMQRLRSVPAAAAHWQTLGSSSVWIDLRALPERPPGAYVAPATNSRWLEWDGPADLPYLVLADFNDDNPDWHRQYLPLAANRILVRRVDHAASPPRLDFALAPANLAAQYARQYPSNLACLSTLIEALAGVLAKMT